MRAVLSSLRCPAHCAPTNICAVATALSEGEARRKHVVMIEIMGQQVRAGMLAVCSQCMLAGSLLQML